MTLFEFVGRRSCDAYTYVGVYPVTSSFLEKLYTTAMFSYKTLCPTVFIELDNEPDLIPSSNPQCDNEKRLIDGEEDLQAAVPDEVKAWLASTFTKPPELTLTKPSFKTVATAIRGGIRLFKRASSWQNAPIPAPLKPFLLCEHWDFDVFLLNDESENHAMRYLGLHLFNYYGLLGTFRISWRTLDNFLLALEAGYSKHGNPYHNLKHGADVTQTVHWIISQSGLLGGLSDCETLALIYAALIHDYEHTGHTNNFHVQSSSKFALLYNDKSVLENFHVSSTFQLMIDDPETNILANLRKEEYQEFRKLVIEMVLATDMSTHFVQVKTVKSMLSSPEGIDRTKALSLIVHTCDISHPAKPWDIHYKWSEMLQEEFFRQGDQEVELGLPCSPLCDRNSTHFAESQIGFIDFIVEPVMILMNDMLIKLVEPLVVMPPPGMGVTRTASSPGLTEGLGSRVSDPKDPPLSPHSEIVSDDIIERDHLSSDNRRSSNLSLASSSTQASKGHIPLTFDGRLNIPQPWIDIIQENKFRWNELAKAEEEERDYTQIR